MDLQPCLKMEVSTYGPAQCQVNDHVEQAARAPKDGVRLTGRPRLNQGSNSCVIRILFWNQAYEYHI
jgi:hypothetical protein